MAGELRIYDAIEVARDGVEVLDEGSLEPIREVAVDGYPVTADIPIAASATAVVWAWASDADNWTFFSLLGDGDFEVSVKVDAATSANNNTPAGTSVAWITKRCSCFAREVWQSMVAKVNVSATSLVNAAFGGSGTANGRIYEIRVKNLSSTSALLVQRVSVK